jgi:hypothetical protein
MTSRFATKPGTRFCGGRSRQRHASTAGPLFAACCLLIGFGRAEIAPPSITVLEPPARLENVLLTGNLADGEAAFTLTARARVAARRGATLELLNGRVALTQAPTHRHWRVRTDGARFLLEFDRSGDFPVELSFRAAVESRDDWHRVAFQLAPGPLQRIVLQNLPVETQFESEGAARLERLGADFVSVLPADGRVELAWKEGAREGEGRLFYAAESLAQITVGQGLLRQTTWIEFKVMQGELSQLMFDLEGEGEVTRVQGTPVLAWSVEPRVDGRGRQVQVALNQPQKETFAIVLQLQQPLGTFPLPIHPARLEPHGATRFAGHLRIANEGAVRLEVSRSEGLSQISPEQFPVHESLHALGLGGGTQVFAYRFSGIGYGLRLQADNILPEVGVSQLLVYHLGETELAIDAEFELDVREAPLRELTIALPVGFAIARLQASGMSDYFSSEASPGAPPRLRIVYGSPVIGRQVIQLRLERNTALANATWSLPPVAVDRAKSVRGHIGVSADAGFRLAPALTQGLTDMATAFFPRKVTGLQTAFRLSDPSWQASLTVERLAQSIQVDAFHLFSVGEGIAYGSSILNYLVAGAPVSALRVELSDEYFNVEFTGREIRNWQKTEGGFVVQLHTPIAGAYTLLATYERPFNAQGDTLGFRGARPLDAQSEQGHTLVISAYPFQVQPVNVSENLLPLEPGEVPPEIRLFFDAPVLAAYRYTTRPFSLELNLDPLAQGDTLNQVVDRAQFQTRISADGQVITDARYFLKSKGAPWFRVTVPAQQKLWSATVNGTAAVPVAENGDLLIPLPGRADPNRVHAVELKLAGRGGAPDRLTVQPPAVAAPVLLAEWLLSPDTGHQLVYHQGALDPLDRPQDSSGFAALRAFLTGPDVGLHGLRLGAALVLLLLAAWVWRQTAAPGVHRFSARHLSGAGIGLAAAVAGLGILIHAASSLPRTEVVVDNSLRFLIPVQQASASPGIEIAHVEIAAPWKSYLGLAWPALLGLALAAFALLRPSGPARHLAMLGAWTALGWAVLRLPNGAAYTLYLVAAFALLHALIPAWRPLARLPSRPALESATAPAAVSMLIGLGLSLGTGYVLQGADSAASGIYADSITQTARFAENQVDITARITWTAQRGDVLPLLVAPAVLTRLEAPARSIEQVPLELDGQGAVGARALRAGRFEFTLEYQVRTQTRGDETGFVLATRPALVHSMALVLSGVDAEVVAPQAVSVRRDDTAAASGNTHATLVFPPVADAWVGWKPRSRDTRREKSVFHAEVHQVYVPAAGALEGLHQVLLRPAQGQINEFTCLVPAGFTVADATAPSLATWRFDPDTRRLRVAFTTPHSRPLTILIRTQLATGPLPYEQTAGVLLVEGAATQIGLVAIATGAEVQLDDATGDSFSTINLEDFPVALIEPLKTQTPALALRRAFRVGDDGGLLTLKAAAVEPDIRIESQQTLSLGEDRTVLAANLVADITRAGIFRLSFALPAGLDVEAISGSSLSHWTELKTDEDRLITLHLRGKTEGRQALSITLAGPGLRRVQNWVLPRLSIREASKQQGQLVIVPEQGMRLQITERDAVTQLDPTRSGIRQKGVLAFRLLQHSWRVALDVEQVDAWIQVTSVQEVQVSEGQLRVTANLQFEVENTGVRSLRVHLPANADGVRFLGDQIADFMAPEAQAGATHRLWEVKLHRRVLGSYLLQAHYQVPLPTQTTQTTLLGVQAADANLQRGFLTVRADGRLQLTLPDPPTSLQPAEWQSIPRRLRTDTLTGGVTHTFRLVDPAFALTLQLDRRDAVRLLPARVNRVNLTSVVADEGVMLTQVRLELTPGDKRLLHLTLPPNARFWFAFVNQNGVWPWRDGDQFLIPLEPQARHRDITLVEFLYTLPTAPARGRTLTLAAAGPQFDLPLENITWQLYLDPRWHVRHSDGTLQFREEQLVLGHTLDLQSYIQQETSLQEEQIREAGQLIQEANTLLQLGDPQQARRAFKAAYGLSRHDDAFNEDARVQLHNLKLQQALIGLNNRMAVVAGDPDAPALQLQTQVPAGQAGAAGPNYTQDQARQILERHSAEESAVQRRLAERLLQQQDAALPSPAAIRATVPASGRLVTFSRSLLVDPWASLDLQLTARTSADIAFASRLGVLIVLSAVLAALALASRPVSPHRR